MPKSAKILGAALGMALLGSAGSAWAQHPHAARGQVVMLPPGTVLVVSSDVSMPGWMPVAMVPDPVALMQQASEMIADAQRAFAVPDWTVPDRMMNAAIRQLRQSGGGASGIVLTSFSDSRGTCTQKVTYSSSPGNRAPIMHVSMTGNACSSAGMPAMLPKQEPPEHALPRTLRVDTASPKQDIKLASLDR